jgi:hypothetical protein
LACARQRGSRYIGTNLPTAGSPTLTRKRSGARPNTIQHPTLYVKECEGIPKKIRATHNSSTLWQAIHKTKIISIKVKQNTKIIS